MTALYHWLRDRIGNDPAWTAVLTSAGAAWQSWYVTDANSF